MKKLALITAMAAAFFAAPAYAFYSYGDKMIRLSDLPDVEELKVPNKNVYLDIGYCYKQLSVFFIPVWNWEERYCGYVDEKMYSKIGKEDLLALSKELNADTSWDNNEPKIPMWERVWGKVAFAFILLLLIVFRLAKKSRAKE